VSVSINLMKLWPYLSGDISLPDAAQQIEISIPVEDGCMAVDLAIEECGDWQMCRHHPPLGLAVILSRQTR
jgi:hypothetical protein